MDRDSAWESLFAEARNADILDVAQRLGAKLKRNGADYCGPCLAGCASTDGLVLTPARKLFVCRPSGVGGDAVKLVQHSWQCSVGDALAFVLNRKIDGLEESDAERDRREESQRVARQKADARTAAIEKQEAARHRRDEEAIDAILSRAIQTSGTHAEAYLKRRGLSPSRRLLGDLRFVPDLDYFGLAENTQEKRTCLATLPAMVAIIRDVAGSIIGLHQTYLDPKEPRKWTPTGAATNKAKKVRGQAKGGLIRLGVLGESVAIGEGIETCLAFHAFGVGPENLSLACGISLGNLVNVELPEDVKEVFLLGDGDSDPKTTMARLVAAGRRFKAQGRAVYVSVAPLGQDFNDMAREWARDMEAA